MKTKVLEFIKAYDMLEAHDRVVTGVSAGPDSVCLFLLLLELQEEIGFELAVVHINHNLRGADAIADETFVRKLCEEKQVPFGLYSYDITRIAREEKLSIEEAGRKMRYAAFADYAKKWDGTKIALAHHQNDVAETMVHNLARGTGLAGMASMRPVRGNLIRPLLCMNRREIEYYLKMHHIEYRTDKTNEEDHYTRNRIRHHVIDYLTEQVNAKTVEHMAEASLLLGESQDYLLEQAARAKERYVSGDSGTAVVSVELFEEHPVIQKYVLRACISSFAGGLKDVTGEHLRMLQDLVYREVGKKVHLPRGICAEKEYQAICLRKAVKKEPECSVEKELQVPGVVTAGAVRVTCSLEVNENQAIPEKIYTKWLDYDKISGKLVLRTRQTGDYIVINDAHGTKKLKDYFIDQKIPQKDRGKLLLLAVGHEVLWVVDYRISAYYKVSSETRTILKIQVKGGNKHE